MSYMGSRIISEASAAVAVLTAPFATLPAEVRAVRVAHCSGTDFLLVYVKQNAGTDCSTTRFLGRLAKGGMMEIGVNATDLLQVLPEAGGTITYLAQAVGS